MDDEQKYDKYLSIEIKNELNNITKLIEKLSELSNIQNEKDLEECNILEIVEDIKYKYNSEINNKNIKLHISIDENLLVSTNKYSLYICISNLI
jgi:signal transduction histidine kinase